MISPAESWAKAYKQYSNDGSELRWPNETLIRLLKSPEYIPDLHRQPLAGRSILDVGFGNGNSLPLFHSLGLRISGTEIHQEIVAAGKEKMSLIGIEADLRVGSNTALPFADGTFDLLVSWNVLHYEDNEDAILKGIKEYARVLKPGGRVILSTTGPEHKILEGATRIAPHRYRIGRPGEFRAGQVYYYFDDAECTARAFATAFREVEVGRTLDRLFRHTLDWFIVTAVAP